MKQYESYRTTNIPWLEEIPSHWTEERAKYLFKKENRPVSSKDETITCFRDGQVTLRKNRRIDGFTESLKEIGYQGIRKGDLVIHQMDAFAGSTGVSDSDGKGTPVYHVCTPKVDYINNYYYAHVIRNMGLNGYIQSLYRGIRERSSDFRYDVFGRQLLPIPPLEEQEIIVKFLETKTLIIDGYKRERERELRLLEELKQAEIANAITQGLNPDAPMKPTGLSWLPFIPKHWELKRLGTAFTENKEKNTAFVFKNAMKFYYGTLVDKNESFNTEDVEETYVKYTVLHEGDIVINGLNLNYDFVSQRVALCPKEGIITSAYLAIRPRKIETAEYFCLLFKCMDSMKLFHGMGTGIRLTLSFQELKKQIIPIPPFEEMKAIVLFVNDKLNRINELIEKLQIQLQQINEYKQRLIADAVTGQINVQNT